MNGKFVCFFLFSETSNVVMKRSPMKEIVSDTETTALDRVLILDPDISTKPSAVVQQEV